MTKRCVFFSEEHIKKQQKVRHPLRLKSYLLSVTINVVEPDIHNEKHYRINTHIREL